MVGPNGRRDVSAGDLELLITADSGGRNSTRARLWKRELQRFADEERRARQCQPLASGHEQMEQDRASDVLPYHRQLAWAALGEPEVIVSLIGATTTTKGLRIQAVLDAGQYPTGRQSLSDAKMTFLADSTLDVPW